MFILDKSVYKAVYIVHGRYCHAIFQLVSIGWRDGG